MKRWRNSFFEWKVSKYFFFGERFGYRFNERRDRKLKERKDELCSSLAELSQKEKASEYEVQRLNEELKVKEQEDKSEDVDTDKLSQDLLSSLNLGEDNN